MLPLTFQEKEKKKTTSNTKFKDPKNHMISLPSTPHVQLMEHGYL